MRQHETTTQRLLRDFTIALVMLAVIALGALAVEAFP